MASNFVPVFDGSCGAFTGRVNIVPFGQVIPKEERDPALLDKLKAEGSGILNRLLDAYDAYRSEGLQPSKVVTEATLKFIVSELRTISILFAYHDFNKMNKDDRIRACYQHCCLLFDVCDAAKYV